MLQQERAIVLPPINEEVKQAHWNPQQELLRLSIMTAVPLNIAELKAKGGPNDFQWDWARDFSDELGSRGDILQWKSEKKGETATMFNQFAYALSIMAFLPGGVEFAGMKFEANPMNNDDPMDNQNAV